MYPNVRAEYARRNLTLKSTVEELARLGFEMSVPTLSMKLNGKFPFTLDEAKALKEILKTDLPLEELFEAEEDNQ